MKKAAAIFLCLVFGSALLAELLAAGGYAVQSREAVSSAPSWRFPLGTDALGRDRLARLLYGTRVSLLLAPAAAMLSVLLAAFVGAAAALAGRTADRLLTALIDLFLSLPWLFLLLTVRAALPLNVSPWGSVTITFLLLALLGWAGPARIMRAGMDGILAADYILQARAAGCSPVRLLWRHVFPNLRPLVAAQFWVAVPVFILSEANLGMLGFGVAEPLPSWGGMLRELETLLTERGSWWVAAPALLLAAVVGCLHVLFPARRVTP